MVAALLTSEQPGFYESLNTRLVGFEPAERAFSHETNFRCLTSHETL